MQTKFLKEEARKECTLHMRLYLCACASDALPHPRIANLSIKLANDHLANHA